MRRKSPSWMACTSDSSALLVSPRTSVIMRVMELLEEDEHLCAVCAFECILGLLPMREFPAINQLAELGWGRA